MLNSMAKLKQNFASCLPKAVCYSDLTTVSLGQTNAIYSRSLSLWFDFFPIFILCVVVSGEQCFQMTLVRWLSLTVQIERPKQQCCSYWHIFYFKWFRLLWIIWFEMNLFSEFTFFHIKNRNFYVLRLQCNKIELNWLKIETNCRFKWNQNWYEWNASLSSFKYFFPRNQSNVCLFTWDNCNLVKDCLKFGENSYVTALLHRPEIKCIKMGEFTKIDKIQSRRNLVFYHKYIWNVKWSHS